MNQCLGSFLNNIASAQVIASQKINPNGQFLHTQNRCRTLDMMQLYSFDLLCTGELLAAQY